MKRLMRSLGYTVGAFASAAEFLDFARLNEVSCLIADVQMPGMSGAELYARMVETRQTVPTILVTGYPDESARVQSLKDGILCYLPKPFDDNELLDCVRQAVDGGPSETEGS
jgi:FixJ family two-component response regulator